MIDILANRTFFPTSNNKIPKVAHWKEEHLPKDQALEKWPAETFWGMPTGDGLVVVDVDTKHGASLNDAYKLGFPSTTFIVKTPSGGYHLYYKTKDLFGNSVSKVSKGIDIRDNGGYVLVPNSPGYEVIQEVEPVEIHKQDITMPEVPKATIFVDSDEMIPDGQRDHTLFLKASSFRAKGMGQSEISACLHAINQKLCNPPLDFNQVEKIINQVMRYEEGGQLDADEGSLVSLEDLTSREGHAKETFIWRQHLPTAMPVLIVARGGLGKTEMLLGVIKEILDQDPNNTALWLAVENNMFDTRIKAEQKKGLDNKRLYVLQNKRGGYSFNFSQEIDRKILDKTLNQIKPKIVVIDSLRSMTTQDLNHKDIGDTMALLQEIVCEKYRATLVYIHHSNKQDVQANNSVNQIMGSATIDAQVRVAYELRKIQENYRLLHVIKNNLMNKPKDLCFVKDAQGQFFFEEKPQGLVTIESILAGIFSKEKQVEGRTAYIAINDALGPSKEEISAARKALGIQIKQDEDTGKWYWFVNDLIEE